MKDGLTHLPVTIESKTITADPNTNQPLDSWATYWETKGAITYTAADEKKDSPQFLGTNKAILHVRFRTDKEPTPVMRATVDGKTWAIEGVKPVGGRRKYFEIKLYYNDGIQNGSNRY